MTTPAFEKNIGKTLKHEGGYVNDVSDPGGETNFGISKRSYPDVDIKNLTIEQAKIIYFNDFWKPFFYEKIDVDLAGKVFDTAVNIGPKKAFKLLQQAVNNYGANLLVDGSVGEKTIQAVNKLDPKILLAEFRVQQEQYYNSLVTSNPKLKKFINGWIKRARS